MKTARIDLHLHLDGSIDLPWAYEVAQKQKAFGWDLSYDQYYQSMYDTVYKNREEGFKKFELTCAVLQTKESLYEAAYRLVKKLAAQDLLYAEIRFASQQHCLRGLTQKEALKAVCDGVQAANRDYPSIIARVIDCLMHKGNSAKVNEVENFETIEAVKDLMSEGIVVGLDLAGYENNCPLSEYQPLFAKAKEYGIPYTIHAGEMGNGENVVTALDMSADRIGHGIYCAANPDWLQKAADSGKLFEVCLSSNCKKREFIQHPIRQMLQANLKVSFCCDNMMFSRTNLAYEHELLKGLGISEQQLMQANAYAIEAAFCDEQTKAIVKQRLKEVA